MECEKAYFYLTKNFTPNYAADFDHVENDIYRHKASGWLYKKRLLFDFGWGQESGYVCYPEPTFEELITLIEYIPPRIKRNPFALFSKKLRQLNTMCYDNAWGAISVIMQDHVDEMIAFLKVKIETDYFENADIRKRYYRFCFDREKAKEFGILFGCGVKTKSYCTIFQEHDGWSSIAHKVIEQVYR